MKKIPALLSLCFLFFTSSGFAKTYDEQSYGYPLTNPFESTIASTPSALHPKLPSYSAINQKDFTLTLLPEREEKLPAPFWAVKHLKYRVAKQKQAAPTIFIIAGTGSRYDTTTVEYLKRLFYGDGYNVIQVSSPTSYDFMAAASSTATPGFTPQDSRDLYRVMQAISVQQHDKLKTTDWYLTGYSLGALDAAFLSHIDETKQSFNFKKVLLLNPPVNLFTSVSNLDTLVDVQIKNEHDKRNFYQIIFDKLTVYFKKRGNFNIDEAVIFDFQNSPERLDDNQMAMLIGSMFRFFSADISFTADLINQRGLYTPTDIRITNSTSLTPFFKKALMCDFECYLETQLLPFWKEKYKGNSLDELIHQTSLYAITDYLKISTKIAVMHNADDPILGKGDLGYLRETFGDQRFFLYPYGGHCGNFDYLVNANDMLEFLRD